MKLFYIFCLLAIVSLVSSYQSQSGEALTMSTKLQKAYQKLDSKVQLLGSQLKEMAALAKQSQANHPDSKYLKDMIRDTSDQVQYLDNIASDLQNSEQHVSAEQVKEVANTLEHAASGDIEIEKLLIKNPAGNDQLIEAMKKHPSAMRYRKKIKKEMKSRIQTQSTFLKVNSTLSTMFSANVNEPCKHRCRGTGMHCVSKRCVEIRWKSALKVYRSCKIINSKSEFIDKSKAIKTSGVTAKDNDANKGKIEAQLSEKEFTDKQQQCIDKKMSKDAKSHFKGMAVFGTAGAAAVGGIAVAAGVGFEFEHKKFFGFGNVCLGYVFNIGAAVGGGLQFIFNEKPSTGWADSTVFSLSIGTPIISVSAGIAVEFDTNGKFASFALIMDFGVSALPVTVASLKCAQYTKVFGDSQKAKMTEYVLDSPDADISEKDFEKKLEEKEKDVWEELQLPDPAEEGTANKPHESIVKKGMGKKRRLRKKSHKMM